MSPPAEKIIPSTQGSFNEISQNFSKPCKIEHFDNPFRVEGDIPINLPIDDGARFLFISKDQRVLTHGIHKYPAKFFPELPRWIIRRFSDRGNTVLDPFMGSGTTNL